MTLWELVEWRASSTPGASMAIDEAGRTLTFAEYRDASVALADELAAAGAVEGDVVSWQLPTTIDAMVVLAALARVGAVQNPLLPIYGRREVDFITAQTGSRTLESVTPPRVGRRPLALLHVGDDR